MPVLLSRRCKDIHGKVPDEEYNYTLNIKEERKFIEEYFPEFITDEQSEVRVSINVNFKIFAK